MKEKTAPYTIKEIDILEQIEANVNQLWPYCPKKIDIGSEKRRIAMRKFFAKYHELESEVSSRPKGVRG